MKSVYTGGEKVAEFESYDELRVGDGKPAFIYEGNELVYPSPVKEGLVLWYDFSGRTNADGQRGIAEDLSGNGNHGTLQNFNFTPESGYDKNKLLFDGVDDSVIVDSDRTGKLLMEEFTVQWSGYMGYDPISEGSVVKHLVYNGYRNGWSITIHNSGDIMLVIKNGLRADGWNRVYLPKSVFNPAFKAFQITAVFYNQGIRCYINGKHQPQGDSIQPTEPQYKTNFYPLISQNQNVDV